MSTITWTFPEWEPFFIVVLIWLVLLTVYIVLYSDLQIYKLKNRIEDLERKVKKT